MESSIRVRLFQLVTICLLPAVLGLPFIVYHAYKQERTQLEKGTTQTARALMQAIDHELFGAIAAAKVLATSGQLAVDDMAGFQQLATGVLTQGIGRNFVLSTGSGQQIVNTLEPFGQPLPRIGDDLMAGKVGLRDVFDSGQANVSDVFDGPISKQMVVSVNVPVWRNGQVVYALSMVIVPDRLAQILHAQKLPPGWQVAIYDKKGIIAARSHQPEKFVGKRLAPAMYELREQPEGKAELETLQGTKSYAFYSRSAASHWGVVIAVPQEELLANLNHTMAQIALVLMLFLSAAFSLAWLVGRQISESIRSLVAPATAMGAGEPVRIPPNTIREANELGDAISKAAALIQTKAQETAQAKGKLQAALNSMSDAVLISDTKAHFIDFNEAFATFHKFNSTAECGKSLSDYPNFLDVYTLDDRLCPLDQWAVSRALRGETGVNLAFKLHRRDTGERWIGTYNFAPIRDTHGVIVGSVVTARDITEGKRSELALRESEERLRLSTELAGVAVWEYRFDGDQMSRSPNHDGLYGLAWQDHWQMNTFLNATHPDDRALSAEKIQNSIAPEGPDEYAFDFRVIHPDQSVHWLMVTGQVVERAAQGQGTVVRGCLMDITKRKEAERVMLESQGKYAALFEQGSIPAVLSRGPDHAFVDVNIEWTKLFGYSKEECIGKTSFELGINRDRDRRAKIIGEVQQHHPIRNFEQTLFSKSGEPRIVLTNVNWLAIDGQDYALTSVQDITKIKQTQEKLRETVDWFNVTLDATQVAVWDRDVKRDEWRVLPNHYTLLGYEPETGPLDKALWTSRIHPDDLEMVIDKLTAVFQESDIGYEYEARWRHANGTYRWCSTIGRITERDTEGKATRIMGVRMDITDRKLAEVQLRIAATAFEAQPAMTVTDANNVILRVNNAFTEVTGYSSEEAVGQTPRLLQSGRHDASFYKAMWASIEATGSWQGEIWNRRKNGEVYPELLSVSAVKYGDGKASHYVGVFTDISARKAIEAKIENLAFYDPLTGLPNRRLLLDRLQQVIANSVRRGTQSALLFVDLDEFKNLNDTAGHSTGDALLEQVARRMEACVREDDTVARLGGDEFVVLLQGLGALAEEAANQAASVGEKILTSLARTYQLGDIEHRSTASIGITLVGVEAQQDLEHCLQQADLAMYQAKEAGKNTLRFFEPQMQAAMTARVSLQADLHLAVAKQQFALHYQAQVVEDNRIGGVEALVRWHHPQRGMVSPFDFISLAEDTGLIIPLGRWVLETACTQLALWAHVPHMADLTMAVNVSARQFLQTDWVKQVLAILEKTGANPHRLKLELTESVLASNIQDVIGKMTLLKAHGIGFSLDDFGTGYSSLSYLKLLPMDQLKIDRSFVRDILVDPNDAAIAQMVIALAKTLGLAVIAEGVETEAQRDALASLGCHAYQGYLCSKPLPRDEIEAFVKRI